MYLIGFSNVSFNDLVEKPDQPLQDRSLHGYLVTPHIQNIPTLIRYTSDINEAPPNSDLHTFTLKLVTQNSNVHPFCVALIPKNPELHTFYVELAHKSPDVEPFNSEFRPWNVNAEAFNPALEVVNLTRIT
jgi:hypothetical protein